MGLFLIFVELNEESAATRVFRWNVKIQQVAIYISFAERVATKGNS